MNLRAHSLCALALALAMSTTSLSAQTPGRGPWTSELHGLAGAVEGPLRAALQALPDDAVVALRVEGSEALAAPLGQWATSVITATHHRALSLTDTAADMDAMAAGARATGAHAVVRVRPETVGGVLRVQVTLAELASDPWRTFLAVQEPAARVRGAWAQDVALTAPTRGALGITLPPRWPAVALGRPRTITTPFRAVLAMASTDLDADGRDELVVVLPERVRAARVVGASLAFIPDVQALLSVLGNAPMPLRQPVASLAVDPALGLLVRTSQFAEMGVLRLANNQLAVSALDGMDLYPAQGMGCVALQPGTDLVRAVGACAMPFQAPAVSTAMAAVPVALTVGAVRFEATPEPSGRVEVRHRDEADRRVLRTVTIADMAPPLALVDLDDDGDPELLGAAAGEPGAPDRLRVFTLRPTALEERTGINTPGPIEAIAAGDLDGDGQREVVVSAGDPTRHTSVLWVLP